MFRGQLDSDGEDNVWHPLFLLSPPTAPQSFIPILKG